MDLEAIFNPKSVAIIGASENPYKIGGQAVRAILDCGYSGAIYLVNPEHENILGQKCNGAIQDLPLGIDLYIFCIPAAETPEALQRVTERQGRAGIIFAGGFREMGGRGVALETKIREIAGSRFLVVGPNVAGIVNFHGPLNATFLPSWRAFPKGKVSILSQSAGMGFAIMSALADENVGISKYISIGNRTNLDFPEYLSYLRDDPTTEIICIFIEGTERARELYEDVMICAQQKRILVRLGGHHKSSARTALSHTGSMASEPALYRAALQQAGCMVVDDVREMARVAKFLLYYPAVDASKGPAVITHTAGPSIIIADTLEQGGVYLPELAPQTQQKIREIVPEAANVTNPVDTVGGAAFDHRIYIRCLETVLSDSRVGLVIITYAHLLNPDIKFPVREIARLSKQWKKPVMVCMIAPRFSRVANDEADEWEVEGIPVYRYPEDAGKTVVNLYKVFSRPN
ncbi:MAG: hypothetical protein D9V47_14090 [Clostridia bacterium]|nr:MAG: hypothetical protein D9V47_14090 [Clostridia bacterium]